MMMQAEMYKVGTMGDGFLAIMACPSIEAEAPASVANVARLGIRQVVSLLEPTEARNLGLEVERLEVKACEMGFISFPIPDMGLPASVEDFAQITQMLFTQVNAGINTLVHCRAGIGRSGLLAAGVLLHTGMNAEEAFAYVSRMRGIRVPETPEQHGWLVTHHAAIVART
jgi:protein-tyrosine phosphatase